MAVFASSTTARGLHVYRVLRPVLAMRRRGPDPSCWSQPHSACMHAPNVASATGRVALTVTLYPGDYSREE